MIKVDIVIPVYMDADLSSDLKSLPNLLTAVINRDFTIAIGSRNLPSSKVYNRSWRRTIISKGYNLLLRLLLGTEISDMQCGFKAATREAIQTIFPLIQMEDWSTRERSSAWFWDTEFLVIAEKLGLRIYEEPVIFYDDASSTVHFFADAWEDICGIVRLLKNKPWRQ